MPPYGLGSLQTWSRHLSDQWPTTGSGNPWWPLCVPLLSLSLEPQTSSPHSSCHAIPSLSKIRSPVSPYVVLSRYRQTHLLVLVTLHPRDLVTFLQAQLMQSHRVGLEYLSVTQNDKSCSWCIHLYISFGNLRDNFMITQLQCDIWCSQGNLRRQWLNMISRSKVWVLRFHIIIMLNFVTVSHCDTYILGVCPSHHSSNDMTPMSIDINVHDQESLIIYCPMD